MTGSQLLTDRESYMNDNVMARSVEFEEDFNKNVAKKAAEITDSVFLSQDSHSKNATKKNNIRFD